MADGDSIEVTTSTSGINHDPDHKIPFELGTVPLDGTTGPAIALNGVTYNRMAVDASTTGRNQNGDMVRDLLCQKEKWEFTFAPCTPTQMLNLFEAIDGESFEITVPFRLSATDAKFYVGDRSAPVYFYSEEAGTWLIQGLKLNVIEM